MEKKKNVPVLRFPEFSGEWEQKKLGEVITQMQSGVSRKLNDNDIGLPILRSNNIQNGGLDVTDIKYWYLKDDQGVNLENYYLKENDVLVNFINSLAQIGKVALFSDLLNRDTIFTTNLLRLSFKNTVDTRFVFYNFNLKNYQDYIQSITKPAVNQASFTTKEFQNYILDLATLHEQQKISSALSAVDDKLQALKKKRTLLEQYKKGMMQKLFSQELRFKDDNGAAFPKWEQKKLGKVTEINPKNGMLPDTFIYIDLESVVSGVLLKEDLIESINAPSRAQRILRKGDILFQMVRPYQKNNLYFEKSGDYVASTGYAQIRTSNCSKFIFQYLHFQKFVDKVIERCTGTSYPAINSTDLSNISIAFPCFEERTKIANFLSAIDDKINLCNTQIEKTEQWKKGLLQKMFV